MRASYLILQTINVSRRVIRIYKNEASVSGKILNQEQSLILISYKSRSQMKVNRSFLTLLSHLKSRDNIFSESLGWGTESGTDVPYLISFSLGPHFTPSRGCCTTHFPEVRLKEWMQAEWKGEGNEGRRKEEEREVWVQQIRSCFRQFLILSWRRSWDLKIPKWSFCCWFFFFLILKITPLMFLPKCTFPQEKAGLRHFHLLH